MKNLFALVSAAVLLGGTPVFGDLSINFDTAGNWSAGSGGLTSYQTDHDYTESGFSFTGGDALRQSNSTVDGVAAALGTYSWRLRNNSSVSWSGTYATVDPNNSIVSGFSFDVRRWDSSPSPDYDVSYSLNGGSSFTSVGTIDNSQLSNSSNWSMFSASFAAANVGNGDFVLRLAANGGTERIMIDNFGLSAVPEPSASALCTAIVLATFCCRPLCCLVRRLRRDQAA